MNEGSASDWKAIAEQLSKETDPLRETHAKIARYSVLRELPMAIRSMNSSGAGE